MATNDTLKRETAKKNLETLFLERVEFIKTRGGPVSSDPKETERETQLLFWSESHPLSGESSEEEEQKVLAMAKDRADRGFPDDQFLLGVIYLLGSGVERDSRQGIAWIEKAAESNQLWAVYSLARMYKRGLYVPLDMQMAAKYFKMNAASHLSISEGRLGEIYAYGIGVRQDYDEAMRWYRTCDEETRFTSKVGDSWCKYNIGRMYAQGKGVPQDYVVAAEWLLKAVEYGKNYGGDVFPAERALVIMYSTGLGVPQDETQADFWLHRPNITINKTCRDIAQAQH